MWEFVTAFPVVQWIDLIDWCVGKMRRICYSHGTRYETNAIKNKVYDVSAFISVTHTNCTFPIKWRFGTDMFFFIFIQLIYLLTSLKTKCSKVMEFISLRKLMCKLRKCQFLQYEFLYHFYGQNINLHVVDYRSHSFFLQIHNK